MSPAFSFTWRVERLGTVLIVPEPSPIVSRQTVPNRLMTECGNGMLKIYGEFDILTMYAPFFGA